jgi:hypothetical protein
MGKGNARLIAWEGDKTMSLSIEDSLISPVSIAMLSGAGILKGVGDNDNADGKQKVYTHETFDLVIEGEAGNYYADLLPEVRDNATLCVTKEAPVYGVILDNSGRQKTFLSAITDDEIQVIASDSEEAVAAEISDRGIVKAGGEDTIRFVLSDTPSGNNTYDDDEGVMEAGQTVRIDCYTVHGAGAQTLQIDASNFAGYYYIEADTLFRDEEGNDFPAQFVIPRGKIQSNFTLTMSSTGDPSTVTFTVDAFPAYTKFNKTKKVLAEIQIIDSEGETHNYADKSVIGHAQRTSDAEVDDFYSGSVFSQN